jgi:acyl-CoA oxidase
MSDFTASLKPQYDGEAILEAERQKSTISVEELSQHLLSRNGFLERQSRILKLLESDPLFSKKEQLEQSRIERFTVGLSRNKKMRRLAQEHSWDLEDYKVAEYLVDEMSPYYLHYGMFATSVKQQGDEKQIKEWMPDINDFKIIGCYAQTEMGHGSNVRGLETTASYDVKNKEWVIHSPTLTAAKWWPGALGRTATHAIVVAQSLAPDDKGKCVSQGPHQFVCRIRDQKTHQPLNHIVIGDIGPKYGYASMDNGYMLFDHLRLPHSALLCKYSRVDPHTGRFSRHGHPAIVYSALTATRASIIMHARLVLARAVTIAVRYTAVRKQFQDRDDTSGKSQEMAVLDYSTVQIRLLPLLATTFALHYTGEAISKLFAESNERIRKGDLSPLAEMHSLSSGLKSLCTQYAADGIEICRRSMGGHGFSGASGLVGINGE